MRVKRRRLSLREAAAEAWRLGLVPLSLRTPLTADQLADLEQLRSVTVWRPSKKQLDSYTPLQLFHSALARVGRPAFRTDPVLVARGYELWGAAERLERDRASADLRDDGVVSAATYDAVADAYLVAGDAYDEAGAYNMAYRMRHDAHRFRNLAGVAKASKLLDDRVQRDQRPRRGVERRRDRR